MSRPPNAETLEQVRFEAVDWFWRELSFLDPAADVIAELTDVVPPDKALARASVMEIQGWAVRMAWSREALLAGERPDDHGYELIQLDVMA